MPCGQKKVAFHTARRWDMGQGVEIAGNCEFVVVTGFFGEICCLHFFLVCVTVSSVFTWWFQIALLGF